MNLLVDEGNDDLGSNDEEMEELARANEEELEYLT